MLSFSFFKTTKGVTDKIYKHIPILKRTANLILYLCLILNFSASLKELPVVCSVFESIL